MKKKDQLDPLTLAMQTVQLYSRAFEAFREDFVRAKIDLRIVTKPTRDLMMVAGSKRDELLRRIELAETQAIMPTKEKH